MTKPVHIVLTTIGEGVILPELKRNLEQYGHLEDTKVWVIGDRKTPTSTAVLCDELKGRGLDVSFMDIPAQDIWGEEFEFFYPLIPYNHDARRVIGYLRALESGCETLILLDDDNFPGKDDLVGGHTQRHEAQSVFYDASGFYNAMEFLILTPNRKVFQRGYPFGKRSTAGVDRRVEQAEHLKVGVHQGMWTEDPDVDAVTWLAGNIKSSAFIGNHQTGLLVGQGTWIPLNTQNTSVVRELIPAFPYIMNIDRYGDVWGGYILQALLRDTEYYVSFGRPVVQHRRNLHDYLEDLRREFLGLQLTEWLVELLRGFKPISRQMTERVREVASFLYQAAESVPEWSKSSKKIRDMASEVQAWSMACDRIGV